MFTDFKALGQYLCCSHGHKMTARAPDITFPLIFKDIKKGRRAFVRELYTIVSQLSESKILPDSSFEILLLHLLD